MATSANLRQGAVPTQGPADPFTSPSTTLNPPHLRYAAFDNEQFSLYSSNSPSSTKRALEAHLKDTDRRIQDASRLGTTLVQQRKDLAAKLKEVEQVNDDHEIPADLQKRLTDLEREYNEVGRESARAFLPKSRMVSDGAVDSSPGPAVLTAQSRESPTKLSAPSRRQRNQPSNRVHDIEFATEISTSLLAQVRQLQAALAEKDDALKEIAAIRSRLEAESVGLVQRIRHMDESEQKYKDENWNLETRLQEMEGSLKDTTDKHARLANTLQSAQSEKAAKERELDDLRVSHDKLTEQHAMATKVQEADLHGLRRDINAHEADKQRLNQKIEELTAQNTELARAVSYRWSNTVDPSDLDFVSAEEGVHSDDQSPEPSEAASPIKGTPARHGMLESETLKSSLNHAHRMIQNLKNNIHREKTEKIELKRVLQDARDELETRRHEGGGVTANVAKKRRGEPEGIKFKKPGRPDKLGATRSGTTEFVEDDLDWEDHEGERTPSKSRVEDFASSTVMASTAAAAVGGAFGYAHGQSDNVETVDDFETATERGNTTESEAFQTGAEDFDEESGGDLTETESGTNRKAPAGRNGGILGKARDRTSFLSTASTSADEQEDIVRTPVQSTEQPKYRLRMNKGSKRAGRVNELMADFPINHSPASSIGTPQPGQGMQSLGDELDALDDASLEGTPASSRTINDDDIDRTMDYSTPSRQDPRSFEKSEHAASIPRPTATGLASSFISPKPAMVDTGMMTDPWEPEPMKQDRISSEPEKQTLMGRAGELVGGALTGFALGRGLGNEKTQQDNDRDVPAEPTEAEVNQFSEWASPATPVAHPQEPVHLGFSDVVSEELEPLVPSEPAIEESTKPVVGLLGTSENMNETESSSRAPLSEVPSNVAQGTNRSIHDGAVPVPVPKPPPMMNSMTDEGSQTTVTGGEIDQILRDKSAVTDSGPFSGKAAMAGGVLAAGTAAAAAAGLYHKSREQRRSIDSTSTFEAAPLRGARRPGSAASTRSKLTDSAPPLPPDHSQKIAAAAQQGPDTPKASTAGAMGPPVMPASAYRSGRPKTPSDRVLDRATSRDGTTPRPIRVKSDRGATSSPGTGVSRRSSVSSFASELDARFNITRGQIMYPHDIEPATDPRMIQAITQTMIGEYLWKYTRKAGRSETSTSRHRRFFWIHPYTRTLYWSEQDPSTAGKNMLKAKSVAIDAVRVISDDNTNPPGLHRKSLVVITPGREVVFTAPTGQRHETWFNALSYLLLRTEQEKEEAEDVLNDEDINEFNPGLGPRMRRSFNKMTGRSQSRASLSSYNSRTTRNSSPLRPEVRNSVARRHSNTALKAGGDSATPAPTLTQRPASRSNAARESSSMSNRLSSFASRFRPPSRARSSVDNVGGDPAQIYDASVVSDSAEDLRAVIEQQERDADRLENVRACCGGEFFQNYPSLL